MRWTLPNILTVARLIAAPSLVAIYVVFPSPYADWIAIVLFILAAVTDYFDGMLARRWEQISSFGRMLDPIADKAMTIIALAMLAPLLQGQSLFIIPAMAIILREVFISGLREFLGGQKIDLPVTRLAKWKTAVQMLAISVLFGHLLFQHYYVALSWGMDTQMQMAILRGEVEDLHGLAWRYQGWQYSYFAGIVLLWLAALMTLVTGFQYFRAALPYLRDEEQT